MIEKEREICCLRANWKEAITYLRNEWNAVVDIFNYGEHLHGQQYS